VPLLPTDAQRSLQRLEDRAGTLARELAAARRAGLPTGDLADRLADARKLADAAAQPVEREKLARRLEVARNAYQRRPSSENRTLIKRLALTLEQ
jgi:hypothetical protein